MINYTNIIGYYNFVFDELADPRTNNWFLMKDPCYGLLILAVYLLFVNSWGPKFMKNRKPFKLNKTLIVYNFVQVLISTWIFVEMARMVHYYFLVKLIELLDTVFFVLRKKDKQITFLHIYHHTLMPIASWGATKYFPGGHGTFVGLINSFVHIIMYSYYLLTAMGPQYQKFVRWKRYLTTLQLIQFCLVFLHNIQLLFIDCGYPKWSAYLTLPNAIFFYYLFADFYKMAYGNRGDIKKLMKDGINEKLTDCNGCYTCDTNLVDGENICRLKFE